MAFIVDDRTNEVDVNIKTDAHHQYQISSNVTLARNYTHQRMTVSRRSVHFLLLPKKVPPISSKCQSSGGSYGLTFEPFSRANDSMAYDPTPHLLLAWFFVIVVGCTFS